jgi:hypothetical protein
LQIVGCDLWRRNQYPVLAGILQSRRRR